MSDFGELYRPFVDIKSQYGAAGDGKTDDTGAIQSALDSVKHGKIWFPPGRYRIMEPLIIRSGVTLVGAGPMATAVVASRDGMCIVHCTGSNSAVRGMELSGGGFSGVSGLRVSPEDEVGTRRLSNQNYNQFRELVIASCEEGIVLQAGPKLGDRVSGCWYNSFYSIHIYCCVRGIWLKDGPNHGSSGVNRNQFFSVRVGQSTNTGLQIDSGDTNSFFGCSFEGVEVGDWPSGTPTAIKIRANGIFSGSNQCNRFFGVECEGCSIDLDNGNYLTELYGANVRHNNMSTKPAILIGGYEASAVPQVLPGYTFQQNSQFPGVEDSALALRHGRVQFPEKALPSTSPTTLDDYREGTWEPSLSLDGNVTYAKRTGKSVKIGRHVFLWGHIALAGLLGEARGVCRVEGLPWIAAEVDVPISITWANLIAAEASVAAVIRTGSTAIELNSLSFRDGAIHSEGVSSRLTGRTQFTFSGQYLADR
jgi:hypothetical protein